MPLKSPNLDDRRYKDIIEETKRLIPSYTPEWTDWNEHDPGITLIQIFSHLTEMIIFRLNKVPDKNYIEFLKLMGLEQKPSTPASAHLTFTLSDPLTDASKKHIIIPKGVAVETEASGDEESVVFETEESLIAITATLEGVQSFDGVRFEDYAKTNKNVGDSFHPFGPKARKDSALYLGFSDELPAEEISVRVEIYTDGMPAEGSHCDLEEDQIHTPAKLVWEYLSNNNWKKLEINKDETRAFLRSGYIYFRGAKIDKSRQGLITSEDNPELYWIRCRVEEPGYESPPKIDTVLLNTVLAKNAVTVRDEILGSSDGNPNQSFKVENIPVLNRSLSLEVYEGGGWKIWKEAEDFSASDRHSKHYTLDRITGEIRFGDGVRGKIPFAGDRNIRASYRYGGGSNGNVGSGTIASLPASLPDVEEVTNKKSAIGGKDEESLEDAKKRGPGELKTRHRAVTSEDFEFLAKETPGMRISRTKALPLYHPEFPYDLKVPGVVTVIIVPYCEDKKPLPSEGMLNTVCEHLNKHRLLTTEVCVVPPKYKKVTIKAEVVAIKTADLKQVKNDLLKRLKKYYNPLTGWENKEGWPFGGDIYVSEAHGAILENKEVSRINKLEIFVDGETKGECKGFEIPDNYLVYSGEHEIIVSYGRGE